MGWIVALVLGLVCFGIIFLGARILPKTLSKMGSGQKDEFLNQIEQLNTKIEEHLKTSEGLFSKKQFEKVSEQLKSVQDSLNTQKTMLKEVERKLEDAQKSIEAKEAFHQSLKSAKAEDEEKISSLLGRYDDISTESITLEQKLATSMKSLDTILAEVTLTTEQVAIIQELSDALTEASSQLRGLFLEYESIKKRIEALNGQLDDLEEEYTRLVEQQLGE